MARLLNAGVDSLYVSARANVGVTFDTLREARKRAESTQEPVPLQVDGFALDVMPYVRYGYRVLLECADFLLYATDAPNRPTARLELRSPYIQTVGVDHAWRTALDVASAVVGAPLGNETVARLDLFADFADWELFRSDWAGLCTRAKVRAIGEPAPGQVETFQIGTSPLLARLYRKDIEVRDKGGFAPVFWGGYSGPVVRVEVQASPDYLRKFGFASVSAALASCGDVWRHATDEFVELRVPSDARREVRPLRPEWEEVRRVGFEKFTHSGLIPQMMWAGDREKVDRLLYGCLTTLGALDGIGDLAGVLRVLPVELAALADEKDFGQETKRKRRKQARYARERAVDSAAASASAGRDAQCAPDPLDPKTAPRTSS